METLEQYGIRDVTPGNSAGCSERLHGVFSHKGGALNLFVGNRFVGMMGNAKYVGTRVGNESMYESRGNTVWLSEVRYN